MKCLVSEAMDKCKCEMCKLSRKARDISLKFIIEQKGREIFSEVFSEALTNHNQQDSSGILRPNDHEGGQPADTSNSSKTGGANK